MFRILFFMLIAGGLTVQAAAYAAAPMSLVVESTEHCSGMEMSAMAGSPEKDSGTPCEDMKLACLVAMNCLPPLAISGERPLDMVQLSVPQSFLPLGIKWLHSAPLIPESPPPKLTLTV